MSKDIIKNNSNTEKINKTKIETNKEQAEESQKKAVNKENSSLKAIKKDDTEPHVTMKDYSGKIRYGQRNKSINEYSDTLIKEKKTEIVKNIGSAEKIVRPKDNTEAFKHNTSAVNEVIKGNDNIKVKPRENKSYVSKRNENHLRRNTEHTNEKSIGKPYISEAKNNAFHYKQNNVSAAVKAENAKTLSVIKHFDKGIVKDNNRNIIKRTNGYKRDKSSVKKPKKTIINKNANIKENTSSNNTAFRRTSEKNNSVVNEKSDSVIIDEKRLEIDVLPQNQVSSMSYTVKEYLSDNSDNKWLNRSKLSEISHKNIIKEFSERKSIPEYEQIRAFEYTEENSKTAQAVKQEFTYKDVVKSESGIPVKTKQTAVKGGKSANIKENKLSKGNNENLLTFGSEAVKENIKSQVENSEDKGLKTMTAAASAVGTAVEILKPETPKITRGDKRKTVYNKNKTLQTAQNLNIKAEVKNQLQGAVLQANNSSKKALKAGGAAIVKSIKAGIEEAGENDMAFKAVDDVIKTADTAKTAVRGTKAAVNTGKAVAKSISETGKAVKNAPKNIKNTVNSFKQRVRKLQKLRIMKSTAKKKLAGKAAKDVVKLALSAAKGVVIKMLASVLVIIILIVGICGAVAAAIGSFIWQTSSDVDTTMIVKHIAELDYKRQEAWYKGKTGIDIEEYNDRHDSSSVNYNYLLALDVPPEYTEDGIVSTGAIECMVTVGMYDDGKTKFPTYSGFNKHFSSCDEMLEECRWTTDDYRAALAYIQVINENLGWFDTFIGFVGEYKLKKSAEELHKATYDQSIVIKTLVPKNDDKYEFYNGIYSASYSNDGSHSYFYFGRKFSVNYVIENDMIRFDSDEVKNASMKERYEYVYKYGNFAVGNLAFPLELAGGEKISDRIVKHFGKQLALEYVPPEPDPDGERVYGKVNKKTAYHYANDLSADDGDVIYAPIGGLCIAKQRENRGFEYSICTSHNGSEFDFSKNGFLIKISCSGASYIPESTPKIVSKGDWLGLVADNVKVNYEAPKSDNDTENEDIFADKLFPCSTLTSYHDIGSNKYTIPKPEGNHIHIEMYKLPCDFTNKDDIAKNVLAPELFFDYSGEVE